MNKRHTVALLKRYLTGKATIAEKGQVDKWYNKVEDTNPLTDIDLNGVKENIYQKIKDNLEGNAPTKIVPLFKNNGWLKIAAAACVVGLLFFVGFKVFNKPKNVVIANQQTIAKDVTAPKSSKAMITLSNGMRVPLDSINSGMLAKQGGMNVVKNADGSISYTGQGSEIQYNTLFNPRGSEVVSMMLEDGTKVWLNSESTIKFPIAFLGKDRKVEITGEAYFEVKSVYQKNGQKLPFVVHINTVGNLGADVEVLGTHFNIKAYNDEKSIKTTLLEGSVKVTSLNNSVLISPNQQASLVAGKADIKVLDGVDVNEAVAWKNGFFDFHEATLETVMQQVSRWYDVTVIYKGKNSLSDHFNGKIPRTFSLAKVLKILELNDIRVNIQGKNLIVQD